MLATILVDPNEIPSAQQRRDRCVEEIMIWPSTSACGDGVKDADETDVDCGGAACGTCATGESCLVRGIVRVVRVSTVSAPSPVSMAFGTAAKRTSTVAAAARQSALGQGCAVDADCQTVRCLSGACAVPTCQDGIWNAAARRTSIVAGRACPARMASNADWNRIAKARAASLVDASLHGWRTQPA